MEEVVFMDKRWILAGLDAFPGLGWKKIEQIVSYDDDWVYALEFTTLDWEKRGINSKLANSIVKVFNKTWLTEYIHVIQKKKIEIIPFFDKSYPLLLQEMDTPPWILYAIGDISLLSKMSISIVGTRNPTSYGRKASEILVEGLCEADVTIVSGLARGIDGICHQSALNCGGTTIAVLGTAIDVVYPREHAKLYQQIAESGLIVSQYPIGTSSHPGLFPQRNKIIAGLSKGTVVVEADVKSGSLITADRALEYNRDVFAVPGPITSPKSRGCLDLLKQGAIIVTSVSDILEEYNVNLGTILCKEISGSEQNKLTEDEWRIYHMLEQGKLSFDELMILTSWDFGHLHSVLLSLIMKKVAAQLPGSVYSLV